MGWQKNEIINGIPDWVYEEEFGFSKAFWWSPDSKFLAFLKFDEREVPEYSMTLFAGEKPTLESNKLYPGQETFKYPKAGEKNSVVTVKSYEIYSKLTIDVQTGDNPDIYIPELKWTPDSKDLVVMRLNRKQNQLDVLYANPFTGESHPILTEKNSRFIDEDFLDAFTYLDDGRFLVLSERSGWSHLYLYDRLGFAQGQLTKGDFDVTGFYGYDKTQKVFYYQAAAESPYGVRSISSAKTAKNREKSQQKREPIMPLSVKISITTSIISATVRHRCRSCCMIRKTIPSAHCRITPC